jgi:hypothetical protein
MSETARFVERGPQWTKESKSDAACTRVFREKAGRVRDGFQVNCQNCSRLLTLSKESEDPFIRRALRAAREMRASQEAQLAAATYGGASTPKPETP